MHNELYNWFNEKVLSLPDSLPLCRPPDSALPRQHEFARLEMTNIVVSKRKLKRLVEGSFVEGWDDPRMPTISGMRRRGYPPSALRKLCELIGVPTSVIEFSLLENCVRDALQEQVSAKALCVLRPLRVTISNWEGEEQLLEVPGEERKMFFGKEILLDAEDFQEEPEPGFKRLAPGRQVKLRYAYVIQCDEVIKGANGEVEELICSYDPDSLGKRRWQLSTGLMLQSPQQSQCDCMRTSLRTHVLRSSGEKCEEAGDFLDALTPDSCKELSARCEPGIEDMWQTHQDQSEDPIFRVQFERCGFFALDRKATEERGSLVFNCTVAQRSDFSKPKKGRAKETKKKATAK
eukprot:symbB.v1.2.038982.t1/scaffold6275.1/size19478/4